MLKLTMFTMRSSEPLKKVKFQYKIEKLGNITNLTSGRISIVIDSGWAEPASDSEDDVISAQIERDFVVSLAYIS